MTSAELQEQTDAVIKEACAKIRAAIRKVWAEDIHTTRRRGANRNGPRRRKVRS